MVRTDSGILHSLIRSNDEKFIIILKYCYINCYNWLETEIAQEPVTHAVRRWTSSSNLISASTLDFHIYIYHSYITKNMTTPFNVVQAPV